MQNLLLSSIPLELLKSELSDVIKRELPAIIVALQGSSTLSTPEFLTGRQAAELLGVSLPTLNDWTKTGRVQGYRIASRIRYKRNEVEQALMKINTGKR